MAPHGAFRRVKKADRAASKLRRAAQSGLLGVAAASNAIFLVACEPPSGLARNIYILSLSGAFFAGTAEIVAAVMLSDYPRRGRAAFRKLVYYSSLISLVATVGLSVVSLVF